LTALELVQAENLKDLALVGKLTGLTSLTLTGLEAGNLSGLSTLPNLTALDLSGSKSIADLSPLGRLTGIRTVKLAGCSKVTNLTPLAQLTALTSLDLSGCEGVSDLRPLEKLAKTLTKLKTLDLRNCSVSADDMDWLWKHQPAECKITPAPPAAPGPKAVGR
jgi:internalin A